MPRLTLDDTTLYYATSKSWPDPRRPLVLLHGAGGDLLHWPPALRQTDRWPVLALDLPGHGRSTGTPSDNIPAMAAIVLSALDALTTGPVIMAGHSMGGGIAQEIALRHPDRVAGLALVSTAASLPVNPDLLATIDSDFPAVVAQITRWAYGPDTPDEFRALGEQRMLAVAPAVLASDLRACQAFDRRAEVAAIRCPVLVLCGTHDKMTPLRFSDFLAATLPNARLQVFEHAGHMLPIEQPAAVAEALFGFAASL